jgi:hypothetical protein
MADRAVLGARILLRQQKNLAKLGKNHIWRLLSLFGVAEKYRGDDDNQYRCAWSSEQPAELDA